MLASFFPSLSSELRQYAIITANYWAFTLTDGALRMLVVLYFHQLGYSTLDIAFLFLFYEFFGIVTNLLGGWLGARIGLNRTMHIGLFLQLLALALLLVPSAWLSVAWVMLAQAISGIAKDLNKMSAKSAIKTLVPDQQQHTLFRWVALLTGSKNALKGVGFFMGGLLLTLLEFRGAISSMLVMLILVWLVSLLTLKQELGKSKNKAKFRTLFSKSAPINILSAARLFLFAARDVWFVIALPVYLASQFDWPHWQIGAFLACWIIAYGLVQAAAPKITGHGANENLPASGTEMSTELTQTSQKKYIFRGAMHSSPKGPNAARWALYLTLIPALIAAALTLDIYAQISLVVGLLLFGFVFAINSSLHSYLIVSYAQQDGASLDIGFYYMANAAGRLVGTLLSGWLFLLYGLEACLIVSSIFLLLTGLISLRLPSMREQR